MRDITKLAITAALGLALTFTLSCSSDDGGGDSSSSSVKGTSSSSVKSSSSVSSSSAVEFVAPYTRIDRFASDNLREQIIPITGGGWYNYAVGKGTIDNLIIDLSVETDTLKALAPVLDGEKYVQLKNIKLPKMDWSNPNNEWAGAGLGIEVLGNGSEYDLAKCNDGFRYKYKGNAHTFRLVSKRDGKVIEYIKDLADVSDWTTVTLAPSSIERNQNDELNCYGSTPCPSKDSNIPLNLSNIKQIEWQVQPSDSKAITGYLQMKDFDCLVK